MGETQPAADEASGGQSDEEALVGVNIRRYRLAQGLSQAQLADRLGALGLRLHQTQIAKIERAERPIRINEAVAVSRALGVQLSDLLRLREDDETAEARREQLELASRVKAVQGDLLRLATQYEWLYRQAEALRARFPELTLDVRASPTTLPTVLDRVGYLAFAYIDSTDEDMSEFSDQGARDLVTRRMREQRQAADRGDAVLDEEGALDGEHREEA